VQGFVVVGVGVVVQLEVVLGVGPFQASHQPAELDSLYQCSSF